jgi:hypothetical protein
MKTTLSISQEKLNLGSYEFDLKTTTKFIAPNGKVATRTSSYEVSLSLDTSYFCVGGGKHSKRMSVNSLTLSGKSTDSNSHFEKEFFPTGFNCEIHNCNIPFLIMSFEAWANNITELESQYTWIDEDTGIKKSQWKQHSRELAWAGFTSNKQHQEERDAHHQPEYQTCQ